MLRPGPPPGSIGPTKALEDGIAAGGSPCSVCRAAVARGLYSHSGDGAVIVRHRRERHDLGPGRRSRGRPSTPSRYPDESLGCAISARSARTAVGHDDLVFHLSYECPSVRLHDTMGAVSQLRRRAGPPTAAGAARLRPVFHILWRFQTSEAQADAFAAAYGSEGA